MTGCCSPRAASRLAWDRMTATDPKDPVNVNTVGVGIAIGAGVGAALGVAMGNIGIGVAVGIAIGAALGATLRKKDN